MLEITQGVHVSVQAASAGQVGLRFERENQTADDASREDVQGMILVDGSWMRLEPSEIRPFDFPSKPGDPVSGIHANADGFGKVCSSWIQRWPDFKLW